MCQGTGIVRSVESVALDILRSIEDRLITDGVMPLVTTTAVDVALYILNQKRSHLKDIEQRYRIPITVTADENLHVSQFTIERSVEAETGPGEGSVVQMDWAHHHPLPAAVPEGEQEGGRRGRSRRRRRKRRGPGGEESESARESIAAEAPGDDEEPRGRVAAKSEAETGEAQQPSRKPRRRGRRGGRRGRSGQRPERPGSEAEARQAQREAEPRGKAFASEPAAALENGNGDEGAGREEPTKTKRAEEPAHVAPVAERPTSPPEIRVESESAEEAVPPRRGWWSR
jgi:ribonuclease E